MIFNLTKTCRRTLCFGVGYNEKLWEGIHKIISTHCGIFVNFEISHLMNDPELVLESEIGNEL